MRAQEHELVGKITIEAIRCRGELHRVGWHHHGDLIFLDHDLGEIYDEIDMALSSGMLNDKAIFADERISGCALTLMLWRWFPGWLRGVSGYLHYARTQMCRGTSSASRNAETERTYEKSVQIAVRRIIKGEAKRLGWKETFDVHIDLQRISPSIKRRKSKYHLSIHDTRWLWKDWREHRTLCVRAYNPTRGHRDAGLLVGYKRGYERRLYAVLFRNPQWSPLYTIHTSERRDIEFIAHTERREK